MSTMTTRPHSRLVNLFYSDYKLAFTLPDERETLTGFRTCLSLNGPRGDGLHKRFGESREFLAVFRDASDGSQRAGANFIIFPMPSFNVVSVHAIYVFTVPEARRRGYLRLIYDKIEQVARDYAAQCEMDAAHLQLLIVGEQNDPFRMTFQSYRADSEAAQLDQFDRLAIWCRLGAQILDFDYVQPALSPHQVPDRSLFLRVLFRSPSDPDCRTQARLDPRILKEHLMRFFAISVLKGLRDPEDDPDIVRQMRALERLIEANGTLETLSMPSPLRLQKWKSEVNALGSQVASQDLVIGKASGILSTPEALRRTELL